MMNLEKLRLDCAIKQKKGLHFILASILIWCALLILQLIDMSISSRNFFTFFCTTPLVPLAFFISKFIQVDFQNKNNPLNQLGFLFSMNQFLYIILAMWLFYDNAETKNLLMVLTMIFGAHLLPFSWLYQSKSYMIFSVMITFGALFIGLNFGPVLLASMMISLEVLFSLCLWNETKLIIQEK